MLHWTLQNIFLWNRYLVMRHKNFSGFYNDTQNFFFFFNDEAWFYNVTEDM
jgi:hypothetical protein